jgi:hypothetical protein
MRQAKLCSDGVPANQFYNMRGGIAYAINSQCAVARLGRYLISQGEFGYEDRITETTSALGLRCSSLIMLCSGICTFLTRRPAHRDRI